MCVCGLRNACYDTTPQKEVGEYALPLNVSGAYPMFLIAQEPNKIIYFGRWTAHDQKSLQYNKKLY